MYKIKEHFPSREDLTLFGSGSTPKIRGELLLKEEPILIKGIPKVTQVASGLDHIIFLTKDGELYAMGDDTFGQCGTGGDDRSSFAPFFEVRHRKPVKVEMPAEAN